MMRWIATSVGGTLWSLLIYTLGVAVLFPNADLEKRLEYEAQQTTGGDYVVDIGAVRFLGLAGISFSDVAFLKPDGSKRSRAKDASPPTLTPVIELSSISTRPLILPLLTGKLIAAYSIGFEGGDFEGTFGADTEHFYLTNDTQDFDLAAIPFDFDEATLDLGGKLNIALELDINREDIKESKGDMTMIIDGLELKSGTLSGFSLAPTSFTDAILSFSVDKGKAEVVKGEFLGDLLEARVSGHITLNKKPGRSRLNLKIEVKFEETLDKLAKIALKDARDADGVYHFRGSGTVSRPRFRADRTQSRRSGNTKTESSSSRDSAREAARSRAASSRSSMSDEDREERRKKRRDRLKKRRERMKERREERRDRSQDDARAEKDRFANDRDRDREYEDEDDQYDDEPLPFPDDVQMPRFREGQGNFDDQNDNYQYEDEANDDYGNGNRNNNDNFEDPNVDDMNSIGYLDE